MVSFRHEHGSIKALQCTLSRALNDLFPGMRSSCGPTRRKQGCVQDPVVITLASGPLFGGVSAIFRAFKLRSMITESIRPITQ